MVIHPKITIGMIVILGRTYMYFGWTHADSNRRHLSQIWKLCYNSKWTWDPQTRGCVTEKEANSKLDRTLSHNKMNSQVTDQAEDGNYEEHRMFLIFRLSKIDCNCLFSLLIVWNQFLAQNIWEIKENIWGFSLRNLFHAEAEKACWHRGILQKILHLLCSTLS